MNSTDLSGPLMWWLMISSSASRQSRFTSAGRVSRPPRPRSETCDRWASAARTSAVMGRPPRAQAVQTAPPRSGSQRKARRRRALSPQAAQRSTTGPKPSPREQPQLEHAQPLGAGPFGVEEAEKRRQPVVDGPLDLARRAELGDQLGGVRGVRHPRHVGPRATDMRPSCRSSPASGARRRPARAARRRRPRTGRARRRSGAGSCARRAPAPTRARSRVRTA